MLFSGPFRVLVLQQDERVDGNGGVGSFTDDEKRQLYEGLIQLSERIQSAAERIIQSKTAERA